MLPHLIGTAEFLHDDTLGLTEYPTDDENEKENENEEEEEETEDSETEDESVSILSLYLLVTNNV